MMIAPHRGGSVVRAHSRKACNRSVEFGCLHQRAPLPPVQDEQLSRVWRGDTRDAVANSTCGSSRRPPSTTAPESSTRVLPKETVRQFRESAEGDDRLPSKRGGSRVEAPEQAGQ